MDQYRQLHKMMSDYALKYATTKAIAQYMLRVTNNSKAKRILFIRHITAKGKQRTDYLDMSVIHGLKLMLGANVHVVWDEYRVMYTDFSKKDALTHYGRGYTYGRKLDPSLRGPDN